MSFKMLIPGTIENLRVVARQRALRLLGLDSPANRMNARAILAHHGVPPTGLPKGYTARTVANLSDYKLQSLLIATATRARLSSLPHIREPRISTRAPLRRGRRPETPLREITATEYAELENIGRRGTPARARRAKAILAVAHHNSYSDAARQTGFAEPHTVAALVQRFNSLGMAALDRKPAL